MVWKISKDAYDRLNRFGNTVISSKCFQKFSNDPKLVENELTLKGYKNPRCRVSEDIDPLTKKKELTIVLEVDRK